MASGGREMRENGSGKYSGLKMQTIVHFWRDAHCENQAFDFHSEMPGWEVPILDFCPGPQNYQDRHHRISWIWGDLHWVHNTNWYTYSEQNIKLGPISSTTPCRYIGGGPQSLRSRNLYTNLPTRPVCKHNVTFFITSLNECNTGVFFPVPHCLLEHCSLAAWNQC